MKGRLCKVISYGRHGECRLPLLVYREGRGCICGEKIVVELCFSTGNRAFRSEYCWWIQACSALVGATFRGNFAQKGGQADGIRRSRVQSGRSRPRIGHLSMHRMQGHSQLQYRCPGARFSAQPLPRASLAIGAGDTPRALNPLGRAHKLALTAAVTTFESTVLWHRRRFFGSIELSCCECLRNLTQRDK